MGDGFTPPPPVIVFLVAEKEDPGPRKLRAPVTLFPLNVTGFITSHLRARDFRVRASLESTWGMCRGGERVISAFRVTGALHLNGQRQAAALLEVTDESLLREEKRVHAVQSS